LLACRPNLYRRIPCRKALKPAKPLPSPNCKRAAFPVSTVCPLFEAADAARIRSAEEIARRAIACLIAIQAAFAQHDGSYSEAGAAWCHDRLEQYGVTDDITPNESMVFAARASEQDNINMVWKYEAYWTLLWALGIVATLDYPDHTIDCDFAMHAVARCTP